MPAALTDLERKILDYMVQYLRANTFQPSIREIGEEFGIKSTKTVSEHLRALDEKGYLDRDPSRSRGVRLLGVDLSPQTVSVPCYASLPDARTRLVSDGIEAYYSLDRRLVAAKGCYFVRVRGDGFAGLGVSEGDFVLVEPAELSEVRDGDLVVAHLAQGPGLYRFGENGRSVFLRPGREGAEPLMVENPDELQVTGKVTAVLHRFEEAPVPVSTTAH
jgi:repressor LexA